MNEQILFTVIIGNTISIAILIIVILVLLAASKFSLRAAIHVAYNPIIANGRGKKLDQEKEKKKEEIENNNVSKEEKEEKYKQVEQRLDRMFFRELHMWTVIGIVVHFVVWLNLFSFIFKDYFPEYGVTSKYVLASVVTFGLPFIWICYSYTNEKIRILYGCMAKE